MDPKAKDLTASSLVIRTFVLITVLQFTGSWLYGLFSLSQYPSEALLQNEILGQKKSIARRIREGGAYWQHIFQPEGMLFSYAFYSYGLVGLCLRTPSDLTLRQRVLLELEELIPRAEQAFDVFPFVYCRNMQPRGGVIAAGNTNLMRAGYAILGGKKHEILESFHRGSKELADSYAQSPWPVLASFSFMHERWPVDNCSAVESLRLHDKIFGTDYMKSTQRFMNLIASDIDKESGMMNSGILEKGGRADVPRGCVLSWALASMPGFSKDLAARQYELYRRNWFVPAIGTVGIREWWPGQEKFSKIQEGPVLFGIGAAASGLGMVTTRIHGDREAWLGLWRGLESVGFPSWNILGEKSYFGDLFLMADTIAFWSRTACVWDAPPNSWSDPKERNWSPLDLELFWIPQLLAVLISTLLLLIVFRLWFAGWAAVRTRGFGNLHTTERNWAIAQLVLLLLHIVLPTVLWLFPLLTMLILRAVEKWQLTVKGLGNW